MAVDILNPETTLVSNRAQLALKKNASAPGRALFANIPSSDDVTGIELRMLPPFVKENGTAPVWPFPGYARLYCLTIVVSDVGNQLVGNIDLKGFQRIGDREYLPINKTIFYWQEEAKSKKAPSQIHVLCSVMKSKKDLRDVAEVLTIVKSDEEYKGLIGSLKNLATDASKLTAVTDIITQVAGIVGGYLKDVEDKPLGTVINSYTTVYGDFDKLGVSPLSYPTRNVDFNFQIVVRSASAQKALVRSTSKAPAKAASKRASAAPLAIETEKVKVDMVAL